MNSKKSYNLLWIQPIHTIFKAFNPKTEEPFCQPIPDKAVENVLGIAERNPNVDVRLWIDSLRTTDSQINWWRNISERCSFHNMSLLDLRNITEYNKHPLYNQNDYSSICWHPNKQSLSCDKHSLIWRQVDAARLLACLQDNYDQVFYSDLDVTNLVVNSDEVQDKIKKHGIILNGGVDEKSGRPWFENGLFGFDSRKRDFFRLLYDRTLTYIEMTRENGYGSYMDLINNELKGREGIDTREIVFQSRYDSTFSLHPKQNAVDRKYELGNYKDMKHLITEIEKYI